jgi:hypothetical protein
LFNPQKAPLLQAQLLNQARTLAESLRAQHGTVSALELAHLHGIHVGFDVWEVAAGRVLYLAECTRQPRRIVVNERALVLLSQRGQLERAQLCEAAIAHELGHLLLPRPSIWASASIQEAAAHVFAEAWTGLPLWQLSMSEQGLNQDGVFFRH